MKILNPPAVAAPPVAERLWLAAMAILAAMPTAMALANRSSLLVLCATAACALAATWSEGGLRRLGDDLRRALASPVGLAALAFVGWSAASSAWSIAPALTLRSLGEFVLPLAAALVLALTIPARFRPWAAVALGMSCVVAAAIVVGALTFGPGVHPDLLRRMDGFIYNRPVLTLLVLLPPLLVALFDQRRRWLAAAAAGAVALAIARSESGAAVLGFGVAAIVFVLARIAPRLVLWAGCAAVVVGFATAPVAGDLVARLAPASLHEGMASAHSRERTAIWRAFGQAVRARPAIGSGFGTTVRLPQSPVAAQVEPALREPLGMGHPHNLALQVWTDLGAVGAALGLAAILLILRALAGTPPRIFAPALALLAAALSISLVGHGAWQGWWAAALGAAAVYFRCAWERDNA